MSGPALAHRLEESSVPAPDEPVARWRLQGDDLLALGLVLGFVAVTVALHRPWSLPPYWLTTSASLLLVLGYGRITSRYLVARRGGFPARVALALAGGETAVSLRTLLPFLVGIMFFDGLRMLTPFASPDRLADGALIAADHFLLHQHVGLLVERLGDPAVTSALVFIYGIHLLTLPLVIFFFQVRGPARTAQQASVALLLLHLIGIVGYYAVPAVGPYLSQAELYRFRFPGGGQMLAADGLRLIDRLRGTARDCFPSLHAAHALVIAALFRRHARWAFWVYLPFGLAVLLSTLYLRVHYLVDVLAALPLSALAVAGSSWLTDRWAARRPIDQVDRTAA